MVNNKWAEERGHEHGTNDCVCGVRCAYVRRLMVVLIELPNGDFVKYPYLANGFCVQIRVDKGAHNIHNAYATKTELEPKPTVAWKAAVRQIEQEEEEMEVKGERMQTSKL